MSATFNRLAGDTRHRLASVAGRLCGMAGRKMLDRNETLAWLASRNLYPSNGGVMVLEGPGRHEILKWGVIRTDGGRCLDLDYGARAALGGWTGPIAECGNAIALWSHPWMGYYHWVIDVAPKIVLMQEEFGGSLDGWKLCYPRTGESYEREVLELLGVPDSAVIDTRGLRMVRAARVAFSMLPGWYEIQPAAASLRERLVAQAGESAGERIYLARAGRRRCLNETEVCAVLRARGFVMLDDKPRGIKEQMGIFRGARVIVTPHGAALTNLLWCEPGATVVEMFGPRYKPDYYRNLSRFRGLDYRPLAGDDGIAQHWSAMNDDIEVDVRALVELLDRAGVV